MSTATLKDPSTVHSLEEWRTTAPSPVPREWMDRLDELLNITINTAKAKITELGLPLFLQDWVSEYTGLNARGCHLWKGSIRTGGDDYGIFWNRATRQAREHGISWRHVDRWQDGGYRSVLIGPSHHLTLTYCEGDINLVHAPSRQHYSAELKDAANFYLEH
jgi:hypothetical protein